MSDHGRYGADTESRSRPYSHDRDRGRGGHSRNSDSIFAYGDRHEGRSRGRHGGMQGPMQDRERFDRDEDRGWSGGYDQDRETYGRDDRREGLPVDETSRLIASNKVEGTAVYGSDDARLGHIYNFMVNKYSGRVEYAVMTYGGFLGMGQRYYPLPWRILTYDTRMGGYRVEMAERDLRDAPSFDRQSEPRFDRHYSEQVHGWYGLDY
jgi:hypothetical protein